MRSGGAPSRRTTRSVPPSPGAISLWDAGTDDEVTVEEGSIPGALAPLVAPAVVLANLARHDIGPLERVRGRGPLGARRGAAHADLPGHEHRRRPRQAAAQPGGLLVDWRNVGSEPVIARTTTALRQAAEAIGGHYLAQPMWSRQGGFSLITVHPLGGCVMADDAAHGVVDHRGRVFAGPAGAAVHDGSDTSADGSIVPRPLDVNPLLTISALAERAADQLIAERSWDAEAAVPAARRRTAPLTVATRPGCRPALWFTERMSGWLAAPDASNLAPDRSGRPADSSPVEFLLTITCTDLDALLVDPAAPMTLVGTVRGPEPVARAPAGRARASSPCSSRSPTEVETWHMHYAMDLEASDGHRFHFDGIKVIRHGPAWRAWPETSTLYVTITDDADRRVGTGVLRIRPSDFARQLTTMQVAAPGGPVASARQLLAFQKLFLGRLFHLFGGLADELGRFDTDDPHASPDDGGRALRLGDPEIWWSGADGHWHEVDLARAASDAGLHPVVLVETGRVPVGPDARLRLTRYEGGTKGPVLLAPGFGMAARSYLGRTTPTNLTEYLVEHGYDVWLFDYRASIDLPSCRTEFTLDEIATVDWPAAVAKVRERTGAPGVQAFGHCVGSSSLLMALGAGLSGVQAAVCSQFSLHPHTSLLNHVKCALRVGQLAHAAGLRGPVTRRRAPPGQRPGRPGPVAGAHAAPRVVRPPHLPLHQLGLRLHPHPRRPRRRHPPLPGRRLRLRQLHDVWPTWR